MRVNSVVLEDVDIRYRNFEGRANDYNLAGNRNFTIFLRPQDAEGLIRDGWNVRMRSLGDDSDETQAQLQVAVSYNPKSQPPKIVLVSSRGKTTLPEDLVKELDFVDIQSVDVTLNPYVWGPINGKSGVKAYLKTMYMTIREDPLDLKYADVVSARENTAGPDYNIIDGEVIDIRELEG